MKKIDDLVKKEKSFCFKYVSENFDPLDGNNTISVVVDQDIVEGLKNGKIIPKTEFARSVIQIPVAKKSNLEKLGIIIESINIKGLEDVMVWKGKYDGDFLGWMEEVIEKLNIK